VIFWGKCFLFNFYILWLIVLLYSFLFYDCSPKLCFGLGKKGGALKTLRVVVFLVYKMHRLWGLIFVYHRLFGIWPSLF
jgi:hypothetical protein